MPVALLVSAAPPAHAQDYASAVAAPPPPALSPRDSQRVLKGARKAQSDFEFQRRWNLPWTPAGGTDPSSCYAVIGRFWHCGDASRDLDESDDDPPPEPKRIVAERARLVAALDRAAQRLPGDRWIIGEEVRYLLEGGHEAEALAAAARCRAERWWCAALTGLALHVGERYADADTAFAAALAAMPEPQRCEWLDLAPLLDGALRDRAKRLDCAARADFDARLWWLAQPLYSLGGNDLRTGHFARLMMSELLVDTWSAFGLRAGPDLQELTVRFGWPAYWTRSPSSAALASSGFNVTGYQPGNGFYFFPDAGALDRAADSDTSAWALRRPQPPSIYAPPYGRLFVPMKYQAAAFRRGDSAVVVVAFDAGGDTVLAAHAVEAALALAIDERTAPVVARSDARRAVGVLTATTVDAPLLASVELLAREQRRVGRARFGVHPPEAPHGGFALSDLLLFAPADTLPATLDDAAPRALATLRVRADAPLGVYWESYVADSLARTVQLTLTVQGKRDGVARRVKRFLLRQDAPGELRLRWSETPNAPDGVQPRAIAVDLSRLTPGEYALRLTATLAGQHPVTRERTIEVVAP